MLIEEEDNPVDEIGRSQSQSEETKLNSPDASNLRAALPVAEGETALGSCVPDAGKVSNGLFFWRRRPAALDGEGEDLRGDEPSASDR